MTGKAQASTAQTMKFVYSEAVNRALRQRCRGLAAAAATTTDDDSPPLPPEILLAALQSGDLDLSVVSAKSAGRLPTDTDGTPAAAAPDQVDYEIENLAEIYREISRAIEQVRRRSATSDVTAASGGMQHDRPVTRASVTAASKTLTGSDDKNKPPTVRTPREASYRTTSDKRQKDGRKVHFSTSSQQESTGE